MYGLSSLLTFCFRTWIVHPQDRFLASLLRSLGEKSLFSIPFRIVRNVRSVHFLLRRCFFSPQRLKNLLIAIAPIFFLPRAPVGIHYGRLLSPLPRRSPKASVPHGFLIRTTSCSVVKRLSDLRLLLPDTCLAPRFCKFFIRSVPTFFFSLRAKRVSPGTFWIDSPC